MRLVRSLLIAAVLSATAAPALAEQAAYPESQEAYDAEIAKLRWKKGPGNYQPGDSHARVALPQGIEILTGPDAERMAFLINGIELPETVAMAQSNTSDAIIYIDYVAEGFVTDDDWSEIDSEALLEDIRAGNEAANDERTSNGFAPMHTVGWLIPPTYDAERKTARWATELEEEGERFANIQVIKLGRSGYHQITWAGPRHGAGHALAGGFGQAPRREEHGPAPGGRAARRRREPRHRHQEARRHAQDGRGEQGLFPLPLVTGEK